ncbi:unnamed protein product [Chrysoparadoxa australica]
MEDHAPAGVLGIDYMEGPVQNRVGAAALLLLWVMILIYLLCHTAEAYFCPTLACLSNKLKISPEVAGVTLLAFGNGAPDVFSAVVAASAGHPLVGMGAVLGASIFTSTIIVGKST